MSANKNKICANFQKSFQKSEKTLREKYEIFFFYTCGPRDLPVSPSRVRVIKRTPGVKFASLKTAIKTGFVRSVPLKGQCHEIFDFRFSTWISFPQAPDYTIRVVSNFFASQGAPPVSTTNEKLENEKSSIRKNFSLFLLDTFWVVELDD